MALVAVCLLLSAATALPAQQLPTDAETAGREFQEGLRALAWGPLTARMAPEALAGFRETVRIAVEADRSGGALELLTGLAPAGFDSLPDREIARRVLEAVEREAPGLANALVARTVEVLGVVPEGPDRAHLLYRSTWSLGGAEPELRVMSLRRTERGWAVTRSPELTALRDAARSLPWR